jgi:hypothetical protein
MINLKMILLLSLISTAVFSQDIKELDINDKIDLNIGRVITDINSSIYANIFKGYNRRFNEIQNSSDNLETKKELHLENDKKIQVALNTSDGASPLKREINNAIMEVIKNNNKNIKKTDIKIITEDGKIILTKELISIDKDGNPTDEKHIIKSINLSEGIISNKEITKEESLEELINESNIDEFWDAYLQAGKTLKKMRRDEKRRLNPKQNNTKEIDKSWNLHEEYNSIRDDGVPKSQKDQIKSSNDIKIDDDGRNAAKIMKYYLELSKQSRKEERKQRRERKIQEN